MKTFRDFLTEGQWMYHGSPTDNMTNLRVNRDDSIIDRAIGGHFAADPIVATNFATWKQGRVGGGGYGGKEIQGHLYRTKRPKRSELFKVPQTRKGFDQYAISALVTGTVFEHHPHLFHRWIKSARQVDDKIAGEVWHHLKSGIVPKDEERFQGAATRHSNSFRSYMNNYGFSSYADPELAHEIVHKFVVHMKQKGYKGLVYRNTGPMETFGARSHKSYIIFEPEKHSLEKIVPQESWKVKR